MKNTILTISTFLFVGTAIAQSTSQDTIKVGVNNQHITVTPPQMNQKVSVKIEDSTFNYIIDISKVSKDINNLTTISSENASEPQETDRKGRAISRSGFFREFEFGMVSSPMFGTITDSIEYDFPDLIDDSTFVYLDVSGEQDRVIFNPTGTNVGLYLDATIREKTRPTKRWENIYFQNSSHLRLSMHNYSGTLTEESYYVFDTDRPDSIISTTISDMEVWNTQLQLAKRFTFLWDVPKVEDLSLEYGIYTGVQFNLLRSVTKRNPGDEITSTGEDIGIYSRSPFIRINHQFGVNYKNYSLNTTVSFVNQRHGTSNTEHIRGKRVAVGLAYRF